MTSDTPILQTFTPKTPTPGHLGFNKPACIGTEVVEIQKAVLENMHISGVGPYTRQCEAFLSEVYQAPTLLVSSCTHALEMAAHLLELQPEDEIILPSFTFVSTANAFALRGASLRFADVDAHGQLCLESVRRQITPKTKAVCVVHYAGHSTDMDRLSSLCREHGLALIEDAAQAIDASWRGRPLGTWGDAACFSFHETKNITCGEGGAIVINRPEWVDRAHHLREKGTNRTQFLLGQVDKYTWVDIGSSYVLSDMNAAYLWVQLNHLPQITARRKQLWETYRNAIAPLSDKLDAEILPIPPGNTSNYHLFALIFKTYDARARFIRFMQDQNIVTPFHYVPLHTAPKGQQYPQLGNESYEQTMRLGNGLVRLPLFYNMTDAEQARVLQTIEAYAVTHKRINR